MSKRIKNRIAKKRGLRDSPFREREKKKINDEFIDGFKYNLGDWIKGDIPPWTHPPLHP